MWPKAFEWTSRYALVCMFMLAFYYWLLLHICEIYSCSFSNNKVSFRFSKSQWGSSSEIRGGSRLFNLKQVTPARPQQAANRVKILSAKSQGIFIYWHFTRIPSASHINTLALANTGSTGLPCRGQQDRVE